MLDILLHDCGALAWGVAHAVPVDNDALEHRYSWLADGKNAGMDYLERYSDIRANPDLLLPGAQSIIVAAFNYYPARRQPAAAPQFAWYAYGRDYHDVVRTRLSKVVDALSAAHPDDSFRICVDTAPIMERYWAVKAGVGFIGRNAQLIIPGHGSACFLGEIVTTLPLASSAPCTLSCPEGCDKCLRACPGHAISPDATVDARRCLSYLTIEHRGDFPTDIPHLGRRVYGCDTCQSVCPLNANAVPTTIPELQPSDAFLSITDDTLAALTPEEFSALFSRSAVKRAKLAGLLRNLHAIAGHK
jgi:epoxyqueuosine reductase